MDISAHYGLKAYAKDKCAERKLTSHPYSFSRKILYIDMYVFHCISNRLSGKQLMKNMSPRMW